MTTIYRKSRADYPPGILAIYDNGGKTADRYTVVFAPFADDEGGLHYPTLDMGATPQSVCMSGEYDFRPTPGRGRKSMMGRVVGMTDLPRDCRRVVERHLRENEVICPRCGGAVPELVAAGPHAGERCRICATH